MPTPAQSPTGQEPKPPPEKIPLLINVSPAIFVPLRDDMFETELPRDRVERLKRILQSIDYQREGVRENLFYMFEREKKRHMLHAAEVERELGPPKIKPGLPPDEVDRLFSTLDAPPKHGVNYNWTPETEKPVHHVPANASFRDKTVLELLNIMEAALMDLDGYGGHMAGIKKDYLDRLERELATIEEAGKRPEERSGVRF